MMNKITVKNSVLLLIIGVLILTGVAYATDPMVYYDADNSRVAIDQTAYISGGLTVNSGIASGAYSLSAGEVRAGLFRDGNSGYYGDFASTSNMNDVNAVTLYGSTSVRGGSLYMRSTNELDSTSGGLYLNWGGDAVGNINMGKTVDMYGNYIYNSQAGYNGAVYVNDPLQVYTDIDITSNPDVKGIRLDENPATWLLSLGVASVSNTYFAIRDVDQAAYRLVIDDSGNVGIGTTAPGGYKLYVAGQIRGDSATLTQSGDYQLSLVGTNTWAGIRFNDVGGTDYMWYNGAGSTFAIGGGGSNVAGKKLHVDGSTTIGATYDSNSPPTNGLLVQGNVGIATTSPGSFTLGVGGSVGPTTDNSYDLGSSSYRWRNLYLSGTVSTGGYLDLTNDNLLYNGDFETGTTAGWSGLDSAVTGGYAGKYTSQRTGSNTVLSDDYIPVDPTRDVFQLEGYFKKTVAGTTPGIIYFGYIAYDANKNGIYTSPCGTYCYFAASGYTLPVDGNWHKLSSTTTGEGTSYPNFPVGTKFVRVLVLINYGASGDAVTQMDHVTLKRINYGPLFVGNNFASTNLVDQQQTTKLYTTSSNYFIIEPPSSSNVGIGTTSATQKLTVNGNLLLTAANPYIYSGSSWIGIPNGMYISGGTFYAQNQAQFRGGIHNDNAAYLTVAGGTSGYTYFSGNVGIGTTVPQRLLHIKGTQSYGSILISPTSDNGEAAIGFSTDAAGTDNNDIWTIGQGPWSNAGDFVIGNENNGAGGNARLLIEKSGNVGIGTVSPGAYKLYVNGATNIVNGLTVGQSTGTTLYNVRGSSSGDGYLRLDGGNGYDNSGYIWLTYGSPVTYVNYNQASSRIYLRGGVSVGGSTDPGANNRLYVAGESYLIGNVGIGTTVPSTLLHVYGLSTIGTGRFVTNGNGFYFGEESAAYRNPGTNIPQTVIRMDESNAGLDETKAALVLYNANGGLNTGAGLTFASREAVGAGNDVALSGIFGIKESAGNAGAWSAGGLRFWTKNYGTIVEAMSIRYDGNVGIGTTNPGAYKLYVNGNQYVNTDLVVDGGDITNGNVNLDLGEAYTTGALFSETTDNSYYDIYCADSGGNDLCEFKTGMYNNGGTFYNQNNLVQRGIISNDGAAYLQINGGTSGYTYFNGNVGIGTVTPQAKLQINAVDEDYTFPNPGTSARGAIFIKSTTSDKETGITFSSASSDSAQAGIYVHQDNSAGTHMYFATTSSYATGPQVRMTILNTGSVGIGTTNPGSWKLYVNGGNIYTPNGIRADTGIASGGYSLVAGEVRAGLFRDGNSGYYADPASTSNMNALTLAGNIAIGGNYQYTKTQWGLSYPSAETDLFSFGGSTASYDAFEWAPLISVEYNNGAWTAWGSSGFERLFDHDPNTGASIDTTHQNFRFVINAGGYSCTGMYVFERSYTSPQPTGTITIETDDNTGFTSPTVHYSGASMTLPEMWYVTDGICVGDSYYRITVNSVTSVAWTLDEVSGITTRSNSAGVTIPPYKKDYTSAFISEGVAVGYSTGQSVASNGLSVSGNVGIGTVTPGATLEVQGTLETNDRLTITDVADSSGNLRFSAANPYIWASSYITMPGGLYVSGGNLYAQNLFYQRGGMRDDDDEDTFFESRQGIGWNIDYDNNNADTEYFTWNKNGASFGGGTELMRLNEAGNVGIGTSVPVNRLSVEYTRQATVSVANAAARIGGSDVYTYMGSLSGSPYSTWIQAMRVSDGATFPLVLNPSGGNVGIGTTGPSYPLDVNGDGRVRNNLYVGTGGGYFYADSGSRIAVPNDFYVQSSSGNTYLYSTNVYLGNDATDSIRFRSSETFGDYWRINNNNGAYHSGDSTEYAYNRFGAGGTANYMVDTADVYVQHDLEVDGTIYGSVTGSINPGFTTGSVIFQGPSGLAQDNPNFFWDDTANELGIGTTNPQAKLTAQDSSAVTPVLLSLQNNYNPPASTSGSSIMFSRTGGSGDNWALITGSQQSASNYNYGRLDFGTRTTDALGIETKMSILASGSVGIGTTAPTATSKLHISGGDNSMVYFGPNAGWSGYLWVGAGTNRIAASTAQVISTNGNLHLDSGTGNDIYMNYYASRPTRIHSGSGILTAYFDTTGRTALGSSTAYGGLGDLTVNGGDIYLVDSNTRLSEGSGNALRITTDSGYVDIGPQNPSWAHIQTNMPRYYMNVGITVDSGLIGSYNEDLSLQTSGTTRITALNSNGYVGIGTTVPATTLHVAKTYSSSLVVARFDNGGTTPVQANYDTMLVVQPDVPSLRLIETNGGAQVNQQELSLAVGDSDAIIRSSSTATNGLSIMTNAAPGAAGYNEGLGTLGIKILNTGYVGIGTATPGTTLEVQGTLETNDRLTITDASDSSGNLRFSDANPYIWASSYFIAPGGAYFNSGTVYTEATIQARGGIADDGGDLNLLDNVYISGNVGIGTASPDAKLDVYNGAIVSSSSNTMYHYRNVLTKYFGTSSATGTMSIVLPKIGNTMVDITIRGYDYTSIGAWEVKVSGYIYQGTGGGWYTNNHKVQIIGSAPFNQVRLAYDGSKPVILLGTTSTVWSYPSVEVTDFITSYSAVSGWGSGWSASIISSEAGITTIATPTIYTYITPSGYVGIGTTVPSTNLDVNGQIKLRGGSPGVNKILTSDGSGLGSWTALSSIGVTSVSNSDGSLTISPTTGAVIASLNTAHANTWSAAQTFSSDIISTSRNSGVFGTYDSTKTDQVWSMGTSYRNNASGVNFGNLYGMAYCHTNNPNCHAGLGHQIEFANNGVVGSAIGFSGGIWTSGGIVSGAYTMTSGEVRAGLFRDGNSGYYGDFASTSNMNALTLAGTFDPNGAITLPTTGISGAGSGSGLDADMVDGIQANRIVYGDGARGKSTSASSMDDLAQPSGFYYYSAATGAPTAEWYNWITVAGNSWSSPDGYGFQMAHNFWNDNLYIRRLQSGTWQAWTLNVDSHNIDSSFPNAGAWTLSGNNLYPDSTAYNVGIGTTVPSGKLDVDGSLYVGNEGIYDRDDGIVNIMEDLDVAGGDITSANTVLSDSDAAMPHYVLDSTGSGDDWTSQGAYISLGESGNLGSASLHMTYRGDGYGWIGMGAVTNAVPANAYWRFYYGSKSIYTDSNVDVDGTITFNAANADGNIDMDDYDIIDVDQIGINTASMTGALDVRGDEARIWTGVGTNTYATDPGELYVENDLEVDGASYFGGIVTANTGVHGNVYERINSWATRINNPKGGYYFTTTSSVTGAIAISLPTKVSDTMISFWVDIYDYAADETFSVFVSGYPYSTAGVWSYTSAMILGTHSNRNFNVRFGGSSDNLHSIVYIGETSSVWSYPQITVRDVTAGYNTQVSELDNLAWSVTIETTLLNVNQIESANFPYADWNKIINIPSTVSSSVGGPASATDNAVARFDGTTGKWIQNSGVIIDDSNNMNVGGDLTVDGGDITNGNVNLDLGEAYTTGALFSETTDNSYYDIYCADSGGNDLCEFKTGIYVSGANLYATNLFYQRGGMRDDDDEDTFFESRQGIGWNIDYDNNNADTEYFTWNKNGASFGGGTELMRLNEAGNLGIGVSPITRLHVSKAASVMSLGAPYVAIGGGEATQNVNAIHGIGFGYSYPSGIFPSEIASIMKDVGGYTKSALIFATRDVVTDTAPTERMRIESNGYVGIGTTVPATTLHVAKTYSSSLAVARFDNGGTTPVQATYDTMLVVQPDVTAIRLIETNSGALGTQQELSLAVGDSDAIIRSSSTATNGLSIMTNAAPGAAGYNEGLGTLGIKILNTGYVGIGTATPGTTLEVQGTLETNDRLTITDASDSSGNLRFSDANPYIYASSYIVMPGGLYVSGGTLYVTNQAQMRGGIGSDTGTYLTIAGGLSGYTYFSGTVGIGTTVPVNKLDINTDSTTSGIALDNRESLTGYDGDTWLRLNQNSEWTSGTYTPKGLRADGGLAAAAYTLTAGEVRAELFRDGNSGYYGDFANAGTSILTAGSVGIGTTAPGAYKLYVNGKQYINSNLTIFVGGATSSNVEGILLEGNQNNPYISYSNGVDSVWMVGMQDDANFKIKYELYYGSGTALSISSGSSTLGYIGIGTATPGATLEVQGTLETNDRLTITDASDSSGNIRFSAANPYIYATDYIVMPGGLYVNGGTFYAQNQVKLRGGIANDNAAYLTIAGGTSGYTYFSGSVGIGTTSPDSTTGIHIYRGNSGGTSHTSAGLTIEDDANVALQILTPAGNQAGILFGDNAANNVGQIVYDHVNDEMQFHTATTKQMTIRSNGNVGIGTAVPGSALDIGDGYITLNRASDPAILMKEGGTAFGQFRGDGSILGITNSGGTTYHLAVNTTSGYVGIGTTSPRSRLSINGGISAGSYYATAAPSNGMIISGSVGIGTTSPGYTLEVTGDGYFNGDLSIAGSFYASDKSGWLSDQAISEEDGLEQGDLVSISYNGVTDYVFGGIIPLFKVKKTSSMNDGDVVGIVYKKIPNRTSLSASEKLVLDAQKNIDKLNGTISDDDLIKKGDKIGVVTQNSMSFLKASAENGPIATGDYLTPSNTPGYAMKADADSTVLVGRALQELPSGTGKISAFISINVKEGITDINKQRLEKYKDDLPENYKSLGLKKSDETEAERIDALIGNSGKQQSSDNGKEKSSKKDETSVEINSTLASNGTITIFEHVIDNSMTRMYMNASGCLIIEAGTTADITCP